jgi:mannose/fructose/N-acetylgalactosamine-specific phosphotransferase system component IIC
MHNKLEFMPFLAGGFASVLFEEFLIKCISTVGAMVIGTVISFYVKKHLEK